MKFHYIPSKRAKIGDLKPGDAFRFGGTFAIVVSDEKMFSLMDNTLESLPSAGTWVTALDCEIVLKEKV